jgi:hypothetical protein
MPRATKQLKPKSVDAENEEPKVEKDNEYSDLSYNEAQSYVTQLQNEIRLAEDKVKNKRQDFRDRLRLYNNQRKQRDKIGITTIYNVMNTLLAIYYIDKTQVVFSDRRTKAFRKSAENLNYVANFDYDEMEMDIKDYFVEWDRFFFGVGIKGIVGWDDNRKCPIATHESAFGFLPDETGDSTKFRYYGFEELMARSLMTNEYGFYESYCKLLQPSLNEARNLNQTVETAGAVDPMIDVIRWYSTIERNGERQKYAFVLTSDKTKIIKAIRIKCVLQEEEEDPEKVPWPHSFKYYSPIKNDPFGVSVPDLTEDKQRIKSLLKNLEIAKEKSFLYPMYLYNRDKILNRRDLDFSFNKFIGVSDVKEDTNLQNILTPIRREGATASTEMVQRGIDDETAISTGADRNNMGVTSEQQRTLGEIQQVAANSTIRFALGSKVAMWGEKRFWKLWFRSYKEYFSVADEKLIEILGAYGNKSINLKKKDFLTSEDPKIEVKSRFETEKENLNKRNTFMVVAPMILNDPTTPMASKNYVKRYLLELHNVDPAQISVMVPKNPDEMSADLENELVDNNELPKVLPTDDHLSHIVIHSECIDTNAKFAHIQAHIQAYKELNAPNPLAEQAAAAASMDKMAGSSSGIMASQVASDNAQNSNFNNAALKVASNN